MTNERFDQLTKTLSRTTSRRSLFKGVVAAAVGGALARVRGNGGDAEARARIKMACARLGQPCSTVAHTGGSLICCPHLVCDSDHTCCSPTNTSCMADTDCCGADVCRPNPSGLGSHCQPLGLLGELCVTDSDCAGNLGCDVYTGTCENSCGGQTCTEGETCCGDPYTQGVVCCGGQNSACDELLGGCVGCSEYEESCASDTDCCDYFRTGNAICNTLPTDNSNGRGAGILELSGVCCVPNGGSCSAGPCCGDAICDVDEICRGFNGTPCSVDDNCVEGFCDPLLNMCCDPYIGCLPV
jgi:hypothetical protein